MSMNVNAVGATAYPAKKKIGPVGKGALIGGAIGATFQGIGIKRAGLKDIFQVGKECGASLGVYRKTVVASIALAGLFAAGIGAIAGKIVKSVKAKKSQKTEQQ